MKAIVVKQVNSEPVLEWGERADVVIQPEEVLVEIHATAVNRADLAQAQGKYPPPEGDSDILGLEMAGVVTSVGSGVEKWKVPSVTGLKK